MKALALALTALTACGSPDGGCTTTQASGGLSAADGLSTARLIIEHSDKTTTQCAAFVEAFPARRLRVRTAAHCVNPMTARRAVLRLDSDLAREVPVDSPTLRRARALDEAHIPVAARDWALKQLGGRGPAKSADRETGLVLATYGETAFLEGTTPGDGAGIPGAHPAGAAWADALGAAAAADELADLARLARGLASCAQEDPHCESKAAILEAVGTVDVSVEEADRERAEAHARRRAVWESLRLAIAEAPSEVRVLAFDRIKNRPGVFALRPLMDFQVRDQGIRWAQGPSFPLRLEPGDSGSVVTFRGAPLLVVSTVVSDAVSGGASVINLPPRREGAAPSGGYSGRASQGKEPAPVRTPTADVACR